MSIEICMSFLDKMGVPLTKAGCSTRHKVPCLQRNTELQSLAQEEREEMEVVTWAAVYPTILGSD